MGNAGHILTYKNTDNDPEDVRRVQELEANFQPKSLNSFPANPDVKQLLNHQLALIDDGSERYIVIRIGDSLLRINLTSNGDFVQVDGDTMTGQLTSEVASGAPPFVVASGDVVDTLNVDQVDGFDLDQSLLIADSPEFVALTLSSLTANRLTATDGSKVLVSVSALTAWIAGTPGQITVTDDGDGTITLALSDGKILSTSRYTTTQTLGAADHQVAGDTDGGAFTITLPAGIAGTEYRIANTGTSGNVLTIAPDGAELLIGVNSNFILFDGESLHIVYESTEGWF